MKGKGKGSTEKAGNKMILKTALLYLVIMLSLAALVAQLIMMGIIPEGSYTLMGAIIGSLTSLIGTWYCGRKAKEKRIIMGLISAIVYCLCLLAGNLLFFGVAYGKVVPIVLSVFGAGIVGSLIGAGKKQNKKYKSFI